MHARKNQMLLLMVVCMHVCVFLDFFFLFFKNVKCLFLWHIFILIWDLWSTSQSRWGIFDVILKWNFVFLQLSFSFVWLLSVLSLHCLICHLLHIFYEVLSCFLVKLCYFDLCFLFLFVVVKSVGVGICILSLWPPYNKSMETCRFCALCLDGCLDISVRTLYRYSLSMLILSGLPY